MDSIEYSIAQLDIAKTSCQRLDLEGRLYTRGEEGGERKGFYCV